MTSSEANISEVEAAKYKERSEHIRSRPSEVDTHVMRGNSRKVRMHPLAAVEASSEALDGMMASREAPIHLHNLST